MNWRVELDERELEKYIEFVVREEREVNIKLLLVTD